MDPTKPSLPRDLSFHGLALVLALLCSAWAVFGGGIGHRLEWDRLPVTPANDLYTHMEMVATAAEAQAHGWPQLLQVPRMAKDPVEGYPLFQFYSFLPFHLPALAVRAGCSPYHALLGSIFFSFVLGAWGMAGFARDQGLDAYSALLCSAAFCLAPFHLTDLFGRVAYPELFAFGLMPCVFWSTWRLATRPGLGAWLCCSLSWAALILTHNIFHLWAVPLIGAWLGVWQRLDQRAMALRQVAYAYLGGLAMAFFFFAPIVLVGREVSIAHIPMMEGLNPLSVLLNPFWAQTEFVASSSPQLGLQIGWTLLLPALYFAWRENRGPRRTTLWLFAFTLFMVWAPIELWACLGPLQIAQFPYRLLLFASLFGALLLAYVFDEKLSLALLGCGLLVLVAWSLPWKRSVPGRSAAAAEAEYQARGMYFRNSLDYRLSRMQMLLAHPAEDFSKRTPPDGARLWVSKQYWFPWLYDVDLDGRALTYGYVNSYVAVFVPKAAGPPTLRFRGLHWANAISGLALLLWLLTALLWTLGRIRAAMRQPPPPAFRRP